MTFEEKEPSGIIELPGEQTKTKVYDCYEKLKNGFIFVDFRFGGTWLMLGCIPQTVE